MQVQVPVRFSSVSSVRRPEESRSLGLRDRPFGVNFGGSSLDAAKPER